MTISVKIRETAGLRAERRPAHPGGVVGGFSLVELLVVMVIIGILSLLVIPRIDITRYRMDGAARGLMTAMVTAQRAAVQRQHDVVVAFDTVSGWLRIHEDANNDGALNTGERVRHVVLDEQVRFGLGSAPPRNGYVDAVSFTDAQGGLPAVRFRRGGNASQEGAFYLTSHRSPGRAEYAKDTRSIEVSRATGRASWFYYDPPNWRQGY